MTSLTWEGRKKRGRYPSNKKTFSSKEGVIPHQIASSLTAKVLEEGIPPLEEGGSSSWKGNRRVLRRNPLTEILGGESSLSGRIILLSSGGSGETALPPRTRGEETVVSFPRRKKNWKRRGDSFLERGASGIFFNEREHLGEGKGHHVLDEGIGTGPSNVLDLREGKKKLRLRRTRRGGRGGIFNVGGEKDGGEKGSPTFT